MHKLPSELDDVPAMELMELMAFFKLRRRDEQDEIARQGVANLAREAADDVLDPRILGKPRGGG